MLRALLLVSLISASQISLSQQSGTSPHVPAKVYVYDQISGPTTVAIGSKGLTVLQAMATAEGLESTAKVRFAEIIRKTDHSDTLLDVEGIIQEKSPDVKLQASDILLISLDGDKRFEELFAKHLGRPVPEVSPEDIKAVWKAYEENANHPSEHLAPSMQMILSACKPGVDALAIMDRIRELRFLIHVQNDPETESLLPWEKIEVTDATLGALAKVPMQAHQSENGGYIFDVEEFVRRFAV